MHCSRELSKGALLVSLMRVSCAGLLGGKMLRSILLATYYTFCLSHRDKTKVRAYLNFRLQKVVTTQKTCLKPTTTVFERNLYLVRPFGVMMLLSPIDGHHITPKRRLSQTFPLRQLSLVWSWKTNPSFVEPHPCTIPYTGYYWSNLAQPQGRLCPSWLGCPVHGTDNMRVCNNCIFQSHSK